LIFLSIRYQVQIHHSFMSAPHNDTLTLCLTIPGGVRKMIHMSPTASLSDLWKEAQQACHLTDQQEIAHLSFGYPPQNVTETDIDASMTLRDAGIHHQERILVKVQARQTTKAAAKKESKSKKQVTPAPSSPIKVSNDGDIADAVHEVAPTRRSQRAAAAKATANLPASLAAQEMLEQQAHSKKKATPRKVTATITGNELTRSQPSRKRVWTTTTAGRRLHDGSTVEPRVTRSRRPTPTESDPALALLGSLEDTSTQGRLMRQGWRQAVQSAYEHNQAAARVAAIPHLAQFSMESSLTTHSHDSAIERMTVTYPRGIQGRGTYTETVDLIPHEVLATVIGGIHPANPEALRPINLALLSPRVLWSLAYHYPEASTTEALQLVQPDLNWSFLRRRRDQLSEKAMENLRQKQAQLGAGADYEAAAAAIESVEAAMTNLEAWDKSQKQARVLHAVEKRYEWKIVTPTETDVDELQECIQEAPIEGHAMDSLVEGLLAQGIHNWRELANSSNITICHKLQLPESVQDNVQAWIDRAQQESVEEIIVEICQGNVDAVEMLRDNANSGCPKDLALWGPIPDVLHQELLRFGGDNVPSIETLQRWCHRADQALEQLDWLGDYSTPIG
jgi:cell fate (sporulation/competence/biofilm development) regulator YmcA (YheA/YmcA/DUF963 family)